MALIDIELSATLFQSLVQSLASAGPIPVGVAGGLGAGRLISGIKWDSVLAGPAPAGFVPPQGTVTARAGVTLRHVSIADLDANPNPPGASTGGLAFLLISANTTRLRVELLALDVGGTVTSFVASPVLVYQRNLPPLAGIGSLAGVAILFAGGIATLRLATSAADNLLSAPMNVLLTTGTDWAIRISGDFFADRLRNALTAGVSPPPADTTVEDQPEAHWTGSSVAGSVGLEKEDACWGLFEDVDMSVTIDALMTLATNVGATPPQLVLNLNLSSDVSDWDSFRCWLGSGGLGSIVLGAFFGPIAGIVAGVVSLIAISEIVRLDAGESVSDGSTPSGFTKTGSTDTSASYTASMNLPTLAGLGIGTTSDATLGPSGLIISGSLILLAADHDVAFMPPAGQLPANFANVFDCESRKWAKVVEIPAITVTDAPRILTVKLGPVPVTVFPTSRVRPTDRWSVDFESPTIQQYVLIKGSSAVQPGDSARLYLHTSAGIRRYDTAPILDIAEPTPMEHIAAVGRCLRAERVFMAWEKIHWLVDPPPYDYGRPPLRQWQFTFADLPAGQRLSFLEARGDRQPTELLSVVTDRAGEAAFEFVTDANTELQVRPDRERIERARVKQRWLLPTQAFAAGRRATELRRYGSKVGVASSEGLLVVDLATGTTQRRPGQYKLTKGAAGELIASETRNLVIREAAGGVARSEAEPMDRDRPVRAAVPPFSLTLPGGRVAALYQGQLIIAVAYGEA